MGIMNQSHVTSAHPRVGISDDSLPEADEHGFHPICGVELPQDVRDVTPSRSHADEESPGDLPVPMSSCHQRQNLAFAGREWASGRKRRRAVARVAREVIARTNIDSSRRHDKSPTRGLSCCGWFVDNEGKPTSMCRESGVRFHRFFSARRRRRWQENEIGP